ncbi:MAG: ATP-binding protein [Thiohalomonas sp.]|nr:ATP-binding protein [Thiohalomonas sp.]
MQSISFDIESLLQRVSLVGVAVSALCREHGMDDTACFQIETCVVEAVNNAIIHAYDNEAGNNLHIEWLMENKQVTITVSDTGKTMTQAISDKLVASESESGRGWFIMNKWTDSVFYASIDGVNTTTLEKFI